MHAEGSESERDERKSYKSTAVVVPNCFRITKGFQQRVGLQNDVFDVLQMNTIG